MFRKNNQITVFDIGSKNMKVLTGCLEDKSIVIEDYKIIPILEDSICDGKITNKERTVDALSRIQVKSKDIRIVLSSSDIILRTFDIPKMEPDEVKEAIKFEISVLLPEKLDKYIVNSNVIEEYLIENQDKKQIPMFKVQGVAVERQLVEDYLECFTKVGYKINIIDIQSNCIAKLICSENDYVTTKMNIPIGSDNLAIIDMGHEKTSITFVTNRKVFLHRTLNYGGIDITKVISRVLNLDLNNAEVWKHENDFAFLTKSASNRGQSILNDEVGKIFKELTLEIYQVIEFFISMSKQKKIDHIVILGGSSCIPTIEQYMKQYIDVNVEMLDTFHNVKLKARLPEDVRILANALGGFIRRG